MREEHLDWLLTKTMAEVPTEGMACVQRLRREKEAEEASRATDAEKAAADKLAKEREAFEAGYAWAPHGRN